MFKMLSVQHEKKPIKQQQSNKNMKKNSNKKPVKVVYISNPMKVTTSAQEFSALVQELTGQDADDVPDVSKYEEVSDASTAFKVVADHVSATEEPHVYPSTYEYQPGCYSNNYNNIETFHGFDNVEMSPQMLENNFPGFEGPNLWYEN